MKFENTGLQTTFDVLDKPTVRQWLAYDGAVEMRMGLTTYERLWSGVQAIIKPEHWHSPISLDVDLDSAQDHIAVEIIKWAGLNLFSFMLNLRNIEKN